MNFHEIGGKTVKITFADGEVITGYVRDYTSQVDNPNGIASCVIDHVEISENEVSKIELISH